MNAIEEALLTALKKWLANEWFVIPVLGALVFALSYLWADRVLGWLHKKSLGQRAEIIITLRSMFVEVNEDRITAMMLLSSFGLGSLAFLALWPNYAAGLVLGAVITVLGWSVPKLIVQNMYERRCSRVVDQMVDGLTIMANGVKAGKSVQQAMERITESMRGPLAKEFEIILSEIRLGSSVEEALTKFGERVPRPDVQMFVTSINVLRETGGNLSETFETIVTVIRERQKVEKKIEAMTAQGLMQGIIITLVPFMLLAVFAFVDPNYIAPMFSTVVGIMCLAIVVALQIIGGFMIRKIVTIKV